MNCYQRNEWVNKLRSRVMQRMLAPTRVQPIGGICDPYPNKVQSIYFKELAPMLKIVGQELGHRKGMSCDARDYKLGGGGRWKEQRDWVDIGF